MFNKELHREITDLRNELRNTEEIISRSIDMICNELCELRELAKELGYERMESINLPAKWVKQKK